MLATKKLEIFNFEGDQTVVRGNGGKAVMMIVVIALALVCVAGSAVFVMKAKKESGGKEKVKEPGVMVPMGEMIVNLSDTDEMRYLKTDMVLEMHGVQAGGKEGEGDDDLKTRVRDTIINILSSKHFSELVTAQGKEACKKQIIEVCNKRLKESAVEGQEPPQVMDVYFNAFAMQ